MKKIKVDNFGDNNFKVAKSNNYKQFKVLSEKGAELSHAVRKAESYEREVVSAFRISTLFIVLTILTILTILIIFSSHSFLFS